MRILITVVVFATMTLVGTDCWGMLFEFPCRNLSVAAVVGITVLNRPELVHFAATFFLIQAVIFLALITAVLKQKMLSKEL